MKDMLLSLADELEGMDVREGCRTCPADGTKDCRGDLSCEEAVARAVARRVREIVEHDECEVTTVSAYDLLPDEDRKAIAWVREHGGLDEVKRQRRDSVPRAAYERNLAKRQRQVDESHAALRRRNRWIAELEHLLCKEMSYSLRRDAGCLAPEVLDADGVEVREGDTVWHVETGEQCKVVEVDSRSVSVDFRVDGDGTKHTGSILPANLTHRAPVLAADGKPLRVGETVWHKSGLACGVVETIDAGSLMHTTRYRGDDGAIYRDAAKDLVHKRPDSWSVWRRTRTRIPSTTARTSDTGSIHARTPRPTRPATSCAALRSWRRGGSDGEGLAVSKVRVGPVLQALRTEQRRQPRHTSVRHVPHLWQVYGHGLGPVV